MKSSRRKEMELHILENETVTLDSLCRLFNVSMNTVRSDIEALVDKGSVKKVYGGVTVNASPLVPYRIRLDQNNDKKAAIAKASAALIHDGDCIFVDSGTTTTCIADFLSDKKNLTVVTHNAAFIFKVMPMENIGVVSLPGMLSRKTSAFLGMEAIPLLKNTNFRKAFMASTGVSLSGGVTNTSPLEYEIKKAVVARSEQIILTADSSKFGRASLYTYCPLGKVSHVITDALPGQEYIRFFHDHHIELTVAGQETGGGL